MNAGASQTFTITPNGGYRIASVTVDGVNQGAITSYTFSNVTANHTIAAAFTAAGTFTLTVTVGTGATGTPSAGTYTYGAGSVVSYSYAAQAGYTGLTVKLDGVAVAASGTVAMNASHALAVTAAAAGGSYSISGRVTYGGVGRGSVRITCGTKTVYTDSYGNYTVGGLANGSYTVTPYSSGLSFYPVRATVTIADGNVTGVNFQMGRTVSGRVTLNGAGLGYVTVSTNTGVAATTLSNGTYSLTGLAPATYTVTPSRAGYAFTPASRSVTVGNSNVYGINFTATPTAAPEAGGREATANTPSRGPMRPGEEGVYYGRDEEEGAMPSPGGTEMTGGEALVHDEAGTGQAGGPAGAWFGVPEPVTEPGLAEEGPAEMESAEAAAPGTGALQNLTAAFYAWDHLGTIRLVSSADRSVIERHDYEPFGVELRPILNQTGNTHQFTGHERDQASGYDYMHFRFYGSNMGRFMKPDSGVDQHIENPQSWNLYAYVGNNSVSRNDPTGHEAPIITQQGVAALSQTPMPSAADLSEETHRLSNAMVQAGQNLQVMATIMPGQSGEGLAALGAALSGLGNSLTIGDSTGAAIGSGTQSGLDWTAAIFSDVAKGSTLFTTLGAALLPLAGGAEAAATSPAEGTTLFRVWGGDSGPWGRSWTTVNPGDVSAFRSGAGLPTGNSGQFVSEGVLSDTAGVTSRTALPLDGNPGGLPEVVVPNPQSQIILQRVSGANPPF